MNRSALSPAWTIMFHISLWWSTRTIFQGPRSSFYVHLNKDAYTHGKGGASHSWSNPVRIKVCACRPHATLCCLALDPSWISCRLSGGFTRFPQFLLALQPFPLANFRTLKKWGKSRIFSSMHAAHQHCTVQSSRKEIRKGWPYAVCVTAYRFR
jgi:hypothetical protein